MVNLSFDDLYYHGGASVAVPFDWESEPGTPKVKRREIPSLPPLTPPPSYFHSTPKRPDNNHSKPKLLATIFPNRFRRKTRLQLSPAASSSSSSSSASSSRSSSPWQRSYLVPPSPVTTDSSLYARNELSRVRVLFRDSRAEEEEYEYESSVSTPCFGRRASVRSRGFYSSMIKVLVRDE